MLAVGKFSVAKKQEARTGSGARGSETIPVHEQLPQSVVDRVRQNVAGDHGPIDGIIRVRVTQRGCIAEG